MTKNKKISPIALVIILLVISIFLYIFYSKNHSSNSVNQSSDLESVSSFIDNSWQENNSEHIFWFPKNNIVVIKKINHFYQKLGDSSIVNLANYSENSSEISTISQKITSQGYALDKDTSGLFASGSTSPYYLLSFKKDNNWCQIEHQFEFTEAESSDFIDDGYSFSCFEFNLDQAFSTQSQFYKLLPELNNTQDYSIAISDVQKNDNGYTMIFSYAKSDGSVTIFDKDNQNICEGKPCCDESSKNDPVLWNNDWCLDYQSIY